MKKIAFFLAFVAVSAVSLHAQAVPNVDTVIAKYVKTIGGADKWKTVESIKQTGFVVVQGMNIPFTAIQARPNLSYSEGEFQGNKFIDAYDGTVAWTQNPFAGAAKPTKKDEDATKEAAKEQFEDDLIDYKTKGHTVEIAAATEDKEGTKCFKITMKRKQADDELRRRTLDRRTEHASIHRSFHLVPKLHMSKRPLADFRLNLFLRGSVFHFDFTLKIAAG